MAILPAVMAGGLGALGSIGGSLIGKSSAEDAAEQQRWAIGQASGQQRNALQQYMQMTSPYREAGYNALPMLQYAATGIAPQGLSPEEQAQLEQFGEFNLDDFVGKGHQPRFRNVQDIDQLEAQLEGLMQAAGTGHAERHYAQVFGPMLQKVKQRKQAISDLERRQQAAEQYGQGEGFPDYSRVQDRIGDIENLTQNFGMEQLQASPMYQAALQEMERRGNRSAAARGKMYSSDTEDAMLRNTLPLMQSEYARQYGGLTDLYNLENQQANQGYGRLFDMANMGNASASGAGSAALQTGNALASNYLASGAAQAQGTLNAGNQMANMVSGIGNMPLNLMAMNAYSGGRMFGGGGGGVSTPLSRFSIS